MVTKKPKYLDMNKYSVCEKEESDLIIRSFIEKGKDPVFIFLKLKDQGIEKVTDISTAEWKKNVHISIEGDYEEYNDRVDWYYDNIDKEFMEELETIAQSAVERGFDLDMSLNKSRRELKIRRPEQRKSNMYRYVIDWIINGCSWWVRKKLREENNE